MLTRDEFIEALEQYANDNQAVGEACSQDEYNEIETSIDFGHDSMLETYDEMLASIEKLRTALKDTFKVYRAVANSFDWSSSHLTEETFMMMAEIPMTVSTVLDETQ